MSITKGMRLLASVVVSLTLAGLAGAQTGTVKSPETFLGFQPGTEGQLLDYTQLIDYLKYLDGVSPRLELREAGRSPQGRLMYALFVSDAGNISRLPALQDINRRLALDPAIPDAERQQLIENGRVFAMVTLSMHSEELAMAQMLPLYAFELATTGDETVLRQLRDVVLMIVPNHNPDGMDMVVNHYRKYKGTKYAASSMPGVYHKYVGHDNNRDFVILSQEDTKAVARLYSREWYPQVLLEKHGMGSTGPRFYCPPNHDPIAENIDARLWEWSSTFGMNMARDMGQAGLKGVAQHWAFDDYWPGSTETAIWKNVIGFLTENAAANGPYDVFVEPGELSAGGKGLAEYKKSINFVDPWPGGWWRYSDTVNYELVSIRSLTKTAALYKNDILKFRNDLCRTNVRLGQTEPPYYYILPVRQHDPGEMIRLTNLLQEHGVDVFRLNREVRAGDRVYEAGSVVVPLAQPYRAFVKEVMEIQQYPARHYTPGGELIRPYDITSWSLPLHMGVAFVEVKERIPALESSLEKIGGSRPAMVPPSPSAAWGLMLTANANDSFRQVLAALRAGMPVRRLTAPLTAGSDTWPAGSFLIQTGPAKPDEVAGILKNSLTPPVWLEKEPVAESRPVKLPRIALVETWFHDMDAGWTRFLLDSYGIPFTVVHPGEFESTEFVRDYDVVVFPSADKDLLMKGQMKYQDRYMVSDMPPDYQKGIGAKGMEKLMAFTEAGGVILSWGASTALFLDTLEIKRGEKETEQFQLPVQSGLAETARKGLLVPGAWLRIHVNTDHPLSWGMPARSGVFSRGTPVFQTRIPELDMDRRVIASYPEQHLLLSGYSENEEVIGNKPVMVWARKGKGQFVLYGFNPQYRCSTPATYKLLFNALLLPRLD